MSQAMRIGMFGGAFDPPHRAHFALAQAAIAQLRLDHLHIVPTGQAWHKSRVLSESLHRLAMSEAVFAPLPQAVLDAREIQRTGPSYTADTLAELAVQYPNSQRYLIVGLDQLRSFRQWSRHAEILSLATLVVAHRPEQESGQADGLPPVPHQCLAFEADPISSTQLRAALGDPKHRERTLAELPPALARYIAHHHLFETVTP